MTLNKRYKREIKNNLSLYISTTFLTFLSLFIYFLYSISGNGLLDFKDEFFASQNVEDAHFQTHSPISDEDIIKYSEEFDLVIEKQEFVNVDNNEYRTRVFNKTTKIDKHSILEGNDIENNGEVIISKGYAINNDIKINDYIKISDENYKIVGFVARPDYIYMLENINDPEKNVASFFIAYMSDEDFTKLNNKHIQYLVKYNDTNIKEFRKTVNEKYVFSNYIARENNFRIKMLEDQPEIFITMSYAILFVIPLLAVALISIILGRKIKNEQKMIGTLCAHGYSKRNIINHYAGLSAIPGLIGGILTTILCYVFAQPYGELGLMDYEPINATFRLGIGQMILGILVPTIMYIITTIFTVNHVLKNDITILLNGGQESKNRVKKLLVNKECSFRTKFSIRSIFGHMGRTFALFLGSLFGSFVLILSFCFYDTMYKVKDEFVNKMENYNYQYVLNSLENNNSYGGETLLTISLEDEKGNSIIVTGCDDNSLLGFKDENNNNINPGNSYYVSSLYSSIYGVKKGDTIKLVNPLSLDTYNVSIDGVINDNYSKSIYTSKENVSSYLKIDKNYFNVIISKEKLNIPSNMLVSTINKDSLNDQYEVITNQLDPIILVLIIIGMLMSIISIYVSINMVVTENKNNISMLRVLGYDDKKVNKLLLNDNIYVVLLACLISMPLGFIFTNELFKSFVDTLGYLMNAHINILSYFLCIILVLVSYYISLYFVRRKVGKIDMVTCLKDSRE